MSALKGVIFSLRDVLARSGPIQKNLFSETIRLLRFLKDRGITPVFATNHNWYVKKSDGTHIRFQEVLEGEIGAVPFYIAENGDMDWKPRADAMRTILRAQRWSKREVMYVGNTDDDMKTAVNGDVLFQRALAWRGKPLRLSVPLPQGRRAFR